MDWESEVRKMIESHGDRRLGTSAFITDGCLKAYVRITERHLPLPAVFTKTIDVASLDVLEPWQGRGHSTKFLEAVENVARQHGRVVFVECVLNERFAEFLEKRGYTKIVNSEPVSFYKE